MNHDYEQEIKDEMKRNYNYDDLVEENLDAVKLRFSANILLQLVFVNFNKPKIINS